MNDSHENEWMLDIVREEIEIPDVLLDDPKLRFDFVEQLSTESLPKAADIIIESLNKQYFRHNLGNKYLYYRFNRRLRKQWKSTFKALDILLDICLEVGSSFSDTLIKTDDESALLIALNRIHAKACQTAYEANHLLQSGYGDGAFARWRSLHELTVVAFYLNSRTEEVAKRYLDYTAIENYYEAIEYQEHCEMLGFAPLDKNEMANLEKLRKAAIDQYGEFFDKQYGWLRNELPHNKCNFKGLEEHVALDYMRPFYKLSCHNIHSGPKGLFFRLGIIDDSPRNEVALAGPSNYGLADPAQCIAKSIAIVTETLIMNDLSFENLLSVFIFNNLITQIAEVSCETQREIEDSERRLFADMIKSEGYKINGGEHPIV